MTDFERLLTADEVCCLLGLPGRASLYSQRYRGDPPGSLAVRVGRYLRWDPGDIERWLQDLKDEQHRQAPNKRPTD
jgi:predicted DNA-binding transcriptional regulator AlpA